MPKTTLKVAIEGCCHGELDNIYDSIIQKYGSIDLLLMCGDFQAMRNEQDVNCMAAPAKFRRMGDFYQYYIGKKVAPFLTIVIGGNHESSSYFQELFYGGWLAPNIYYLGAAGVVNYRGLRIGGLSGIFKPFSFDKPHYETVPYDRSAIHSVYHIRRSDVQELSLIREPLDVMLSHDWPAGVDQYGNVGKLLRIKPFFKSDIAKGELGSPPTMELLRTLRPAHWFSAHLHVRYSALLTHDETAKMNEDEIEIGEELDQQQSQKSSNPDEIELDLDETTESPDDKSNKPAGHPRTSFHALDKCLPRRKFLELMKFDVYSEQMGLTYDREWLAILRTMRRNDMNNHSIPDALEKVRMEREWIDTNVGELSIPYNFEKMTKQLDEISLDTGISIQELKKHQPPSYPNNQTQQFCSLIGI